MRGTNDLNPLSSSTRLHVIRHLFENDAFPVERCRRQARLFTIDRQWAVEIILYSELISSRIRASVERVSTLPPAGRLSPKIPL